MTAKSGLGTTRGDVSATMRYDAEGQLYKSLISDVTTTNYYWFAGRRVAMKVGSAVTYLYADNLGSTMVTTGTAISDERYTPWGTARDASQQAAVPYRYTGQREEAALGLYDYGARWYDPAIGRFIQADTIVPEPGNPQSLNRYSYALNNPLKYTDPTGHMVKYEDDYMPNTGMQNYRTAWDFYEGRLPSKEEWIRDSIYKNSTGVSAPRPGEWQAYLKMRDIVGANLIQCVGSQEKLGMDSVVQPIAKLIERLSGSTIVNPVGDGFGYINTFLPELGGITLGHTALNSLDFKKRPGLLPGFEAEEYVHHLQQHADPQFFKHYREEGIGKWPTSNPFSHPETSTGDKANSYELQGGLAASLATSVNFSGYIWYFQP
ncbi:MAG: RHS repeat-associated core domain-containing protein [Anaerolineae bacterium]